MAMLNKNRIEKSQNLIAKNILPQLSPLEKQSSYSTTINDQISLRQNIS